MSGQPKNLLDTPSALPTISKPLTFFLNLQSAESWGHHSVGDEVICHKQRFNSVFWFKDWTCQAKHFPVLPSHSVKKYIVTHLLWAFCLAAERSGKNLEPLAEPVVVPVCKTNKFINKEVWILTLSVPRVINVIFLPTMITSQGREKVMRTKKMVKKEKCFDLLPNSLN